MYQIVDLIEISPAQRVNYPAGLVIVFRHEEPIDVSSLVGRSIEVGHPVKGVAIYKVEEAKAHGPGSSVFVRDLSKKEVLNGSTLRILG